MKPLHKSRTIAFFSAILLAGGLDAIATWIAHPDALSWRQLALLGVALAGIALRLVTTQPIGK